MKKSSIIVISIVAALVLAVGILAWLNAGNLDLKKELEMNAEYIIKYNGEELRVSMQDMLDLQPKEFGAVMDTSKTDPTDVKFTGVELSTICEHYNIPIMDQSVLEFTALDGYSSALTGKDALKAGNVYICISMNGEVLKPKAEGGFGPYMMVVADAQYSQSWCKFVQEINIR